MKSPIRLFVAAAVLLATATVAAQVYKWVDKDGKVQYSDTPPPPSASKADAKKLNTGTSTPPAAGTDAKPVGNAPKTAQEKAKEADKKTKDEAEKAKKDEEAQKVAKMNEERCKAATRYKSDLETGRPIARNNDQGERSFMSDEERSAELAKASAAMADSCNK